MSQSPLQETSDPGDDYLGAFGSLSQRIRDGQSFSGGERNCAFINRGNGRFADLSYALGLDADDDGRGIALTDLDGDGDVDLCMTNRTAPRFRLLRNDLLDEQRSIALLPVGDPASGCPLDAAGAKVSIHVGGIARYRTLTLGDGFCSQSSKWLHFGLGASGEIGAVTVRWPGGGEEVFSGVGERGRFVLKQGKGVAVAAAAIPARAALVASAPPLPEPTEVGRSRFSQPLSLPKNLGFNDFAGERVLMSKLTERGPVLVTLWATWCPPCLAELSAFGGAAKELAAANLQLLALSVDNLDTETIAAAKIISVLKGTGYSGGSGLADAELVSTFERLVKESIYRHRSLPVPTSFLIDRGGWLTAIYKGPVTPKTVLADTAKLGLGPDIARRESLPFAGRWAETHFMSHPLAIAAAYREGGHIEDAKVHLEEFLAKHPVHPGTKLDRKQSAQLADVHHSLGELFAAGGDPRGALRHFKAASHFAPGAGRFTARRILALAEVGDIEQATREAKAMRDKQTANPHVLALNGDIARIAGNEAAAAEAYAATLSIDPRYIPVLQSLSRLSATATDESVRDPAMAVRHAETLMGAPGAKSNPAFLATLGLAYRAAGNSDKASSAFARALSLAKRGGVAEVIEEVRQLAASE